MTRPINRSRAAAVIVAASLAPAASAQTMHWFWNVDVNGSPADTSLPVLVGPGDDVLITLSAEWDPVGVGYAGSIFSIGVTQGDSRALFHEGTLDYDQNNGLGRNPALSSLSADNGTPYDANSDGSFDTLDQIDTFQLPPFFNPSFDNSNPMTVYSMRWTPAIYLFQGIVLSRVAAANGTFTNDVYVDDFGSSVPYTPIDDQLTLRYIVPAPSSALCLGLLGLAHRRRR